MRSFPNCRNVIYMNGGGGGVAIITIIIIIIVMCAIGIVGFFIFGFVCVCDFWIVGFLISCKVYVICNDFIDGQLHVFALFNICDEKREMLNFVRGREFYLLSWGKKQASFEHRHWKFEFELGARLTRGRSHPS